MNILRYCSDNAFNVSNQKDLIFFTHFCVGLSHLREHSFLDTHHHIYFCSFDIKTLNHFFPNYPRFTNKIQNLLLKIEIIAPKFLEKPTLVLYQYFFLPIQLSAELNTNIFKSSIDYILSTERFVSALFTNTSLVN